MLLIGKTNMDSSPGTFTNSVMMFLETLSMEGEHAGKQWRHRGCNELAGGHVAWRLTGGSISCPASFCGILGLTHLWPGFSQASSTWQLLDRSAS
jgi:hypothetical protein